MHAKSCVCQSVNSRAAEKVDQRAHRRCHGYVTHNNRLKIDGRRTMPSKLRRRRRHKSINRASRCRAAVLLLLLLLFYDRSIDVAAVYVAHSLCTESSSVDQASASPLSTWSTLARLPGPPQQSHHRPRAVLSGHVAAPSSMTHKLFINNFVARRLFPLSISRCRLFNSAFSVPTNVFCGRLFYAATVTMYD